MVRCSLFLNKIKYLPNLGLRIQIDQWQPLFIKKINCQPIAWVVYKNLNFNCLAKFGKCQRISLHYSCWDYFGTYIHLSPINALGLHWILYCLNFLKQKCSAKDIPLRSHTHTCVSWSHPLFGKLEYQLETKKNDLQKKQLSKKKVIKQKKIKWYEDNKKKRRTLKRSMYKQNDPEFSEGFL